MHQEIEKYINSNKSNLKDEQLLKDYENTSIKIEDLISYLKNIKFNHFIYLFLTIIFLFIINILISLFFKYNSYNVIGACAFFIIVGLNILIKIKQIPPIKLKIEEKLIEMETIRLEEDRKKYLLILKENIQFVINNIKNDLKTNFALLIVAIIINVSFLM